MIALAAFLLTTPSQLIAYTYKDDIWTCDLAGSHRTRVAQKGNTPCWSPDRRKLCFVRDHSVVVYDFATKAEKTIWKGETNDYEFGRPSWGPHFALEHPTREDHLPWGSGDSILFQPKDLDRPPFLQVRSNGANAGPAEFIPMPIAIPMGSPSWSPDAKSVAISGNGDLWVASVEGSGWECHRLVANAIYDVPNWRGSRQNIFTRQISWSPNGKRLAVVRTRVGGSGFNDLWLVDLKSVYDKLEAKTPVLISKKVRGASYTRDGQHLVCEAGDGEPQGILLYDINQRRWKMLVKDASEPAG